MYYSLILWRGINMRGEFEVNYENEFAFSVFKGGEKRRVLFTPGEIKNLNKDVLDIAHQIKQEPTYLNQFFKELQTNGYPLVRTGNSIVICGEPANKIDPAEVLDTADILDLSDTESLEIVLREIENDALLEINEEIFPKRKPKSSGIRIGPEIRS